MIKQVISYRDVDHNELATQEGIGLQVPRIGDLVVVVNTSFKVVNIAWALHPDMTDQHAYVSLASLRG